MILTDYDIDQLAEAGAESNILIGKRFEFFFACSTHAPSDGICGVKTRLLAARKSPDVAPEHFVVDLAIETNVPGFYSPLYDLVVTSISLMDDNGVDYGLCLAKDIDEVIRAMNEKCVSKKPKLRLVASEVTHGT